MKTKKVQSMISAIFILITGGINLFGYFNLPDKIAAHFNLTGEKSNYISTPIYLILSFLAVLLVSGIYLKSEDEKKLKMLFVGVAVVIANIVMIVVQLA